MNVEVFRLRPTDRDCCLLCGEPILTGMDQDYVLWYDDLGHAAWWHLHCRAEILGGSDDNLRATAPSGCPRGCPPAALRIICIPWDHLTLYCCSRCKGIQIHGLDGSVQFTARELYALAQLRATVRRPAPGRTR